ncbi:PAS domain S-box protein [Desulfosporosinus sp. BG]|uniref:PAS domain S-box protein n=1 Tax=Desulfosporosinus sp. BG TaxID=1633135 RepID=UPI00083B563A|nr:PAS domain S-box protein [Desulfosporosinus sp. BG]ODA39409.1 sporulation kinase [Desulfosporosinus sp. BG]
MKILIVDDRRENLLALEAVLKSPDYQLVFASSGEEALKCLLKDDFAVILLDVQMPGMDGFETAKLIRARKRSQDTPIIFITAIYQTMENKLQGYSLGAIDYLSKPFHPEALKMKIEAFVKIHLNEIYIRRQNELLTRRAIELETMNESLERTTSDLRKAEALARVIGETSTDSVITLDGEGCILNVNPAVTEMFGYGPEELQGQHVSKLFLGEILSVLKDSSIWSKTSKILDTAAVRKSGAVFLVEVQIGVANIEEQQIFVWSVRDITERIQLEKERKDRYQTLEKLVQERTRELFQANEKLSETSLKLTNILESITDAFFSLNHQWQFIFVNEEAEKFWLKSREELIGQNIWELYPELLPEYYALYQKAMSTKEAVHFEITGLHTDLPYEVYVYPSNEGLSVYYRDISERKMFEKEMARLDRLNLIGQMAAGIGHEVRNPMTTVRGFLQLLGDKEEFGKFNSYFQLMIEELDRANSIITEFLSLAKNKAVDLQPLSLNKLIENMFPLIQADALLSDKEITIDLKKTVVLSLDEKEVRQLILNLVRNGLEAMSSGGKMTIRTFMEGEDVVLTVADEGSGIKTDDLEKIGTPFFTTKESGTGLGLATCYSIAARHNAEISIVTGSSGTTFFVQFKQ